MKPGFGNIQNIFVSGSSSAPLLHYVDIFNGNDNNNGSLNAPYATLAYADSVLTLNAPLKLKYPNEKWVDAPVYWHKLKALFPMINDGITRNCYDVANGIIGVPLPGVTPLGFQRAGEAFNGANNGMIEFAEGYLGIGTEDETIIINIRPTFNDDNLHVIFSNGAFGGSEVGHGITQYQKKLEYQMRNAGGTIVYKDTVAQTIPNNFIFASTVKRNNANGLKLYLNGVYTNSPGESTVSLGVQNLTSATRKTYIGSAPAKVSPITADWIKEFRVYSSELSEADIITATNEMTTNASKLFPYQSGDYYAMGIGASYGASIVTLLQGFNQGGPFHKLPEVTYTGRPTQGFGNAKILPLIKDKCNNTITPQIGEVNWIMVHETTIVDSMMYLATSHNGINWTYLKQLSSNVYGMGDFFVDNDDPSDYHNIHLLSFVPSPTGKIYESHPTSADFTTWSDAVHIFTGVTEIYNPVIILINGVYKMFYSTWFEGHHYMYEATCTHDPFTLDNDWTVAQTGNWSGLGDIESFSLFNIGSSSWILYYAELISVTWTQKYSISTDNCATWSTGIVITSINQASTSFVKLK